jgi:hypothetical protein
MPSPLPPLPQSSPARNWQRLACYLPLIALGLEIAWCVVLFLALIFAVGDTPYTNTDAKNRIFDFIASFPVVAGLIVGIVALAQKWPTRPLEWICLIAGTSVCALCTLCFAYGLVN